MPELVVISGEEEFLMERAAKNAASSRLFNETFEYKFPDDKEKYLEESRIGLFGENPKAFILHDCDQIPDLPENELDLLVIVMNVNKEQLQDKRITQSFHFPKLKNFGNKNEYVEWILKEGERLNIDLSRVANALFVNCGNRLRKISSEIEKIAVVTTKGHVVSPDLVRSVLCFSAEITPKNIVDAVCEGRTSVAISYYDRLQDLGDETGWILSYMYRHVLQMFRLSEFVSLNHDESQISQALNVTSFILKKFIMPMRGLWSRDSLRSSITTLSMIDEMNKKGRGFAEYFLESEIVRLSEEARNVHGC